MKKSNKNRNDLVIRRFNTEVVYNNNVYLQCGDAHDQVFLTKFKNIPISKIIAKQNTKNL